MSRTDGVPAEPIVHALFTVYLIFVVVIVTSLIAGYGYIYIQF